MTDGEVPFRLSLSGGMQPTDVAWLNVSRLPMDRYQDLMGKPYEGSGNSPFLSLHKTGLAERESALLADVNEAGLLPYKPTLDRLRQRLVNGGLEEAEATHLVNVFALGILVGAKTVEATQLYANEGIRDIEKLEGDK